MGSLNTKDQGVKNFDIIDILAALFQGDMSVFGMDSGDQDAQQKYDFQISQDLKGLDQISCTYDKVPA